VHETSAERVSPTGEDGPPPEVGVSDSRRRRRAQTHRRAVVEWVVAIGVAIAVALVIKTWVAQTFVIPSGSMENTLLVNDRVLVSKLSYRFGDIEKGDVVVFDNPECEDGSRPCLYSQLIKRVVGTAGDTLDTRDGQLVVNGAAVGESTTKPGSVTRLNGPCTRYREGEPITVPDGAIFVMGDNRNQSQDGRCFGPVSIDAVVGKAFVRVWPLNRLGGL
jgi:signal peptidase I